MKPRFYLIDAHAFLHRAYHALPPLSTSKGEPVGALYGFARMLLQILKKDMPERVAVCFDSPGPTFRHKLYPQYKATRKKIDEDLIAQLKLAQEMTQAMGFVCVEAPGFEADDLMATLARQGSEEGLETVLVTGDKDALQMVGPGIRVLNPSKNLWMDASEIESKFGVGPKAVVDYLALVGDASDNVPGVPGIGPTGAAKLLQRFGNIPALLQAAKAGDGDIPPKAAKSLVSSEKELLAAETLIRLREDAPIKIKLSDCANPQPNAQKLPQVFGRFEFHSLLKEMLPGTAAAAPSAEAASQERILSEVPFASSLFPLSGKKHAVIAVTAMRNPTPDLADASRVSLALGLPDGRVCLLDEPEMRVSSKKKAIADILGSQALKSSYDLKETLTALDIVDLQVSEPWFDAKIAAYCLSPVRPKADAGGDLKAALLSRTAKSLGSEELRRRMEEVKVLKLYEEVELPLVAVLREMERAGIALDGPYLRRLSREFESDIAALKEELDGMAGFPINVNSPKQLGELLFDKLQLPVVHKTGKGGRSTDEGALKVLSLRHPLPAKVLDFRELTKLKSTYIEGLLERLDPKTGRVHTTFDQAGTETGRLSSLNPNLQNIPIRSALGQKIRKAFVAEKGSLLVSADYSQIDLRVLAHVSGDEVLKDSFSRNEDIHRRTAAEVFHVPPEQVDAEMRRRAKAVNFGIVYGQTPFGLANELGIAQGEASSIIRKYFERYQGVAQWTQKNLEEARKQGFVRTLLGRIRYLPELTAKNTAVRQFGERAAGNTPIQGGSADIIKLSMLAVARGLKGSPRKGRMLLQIHDELLFEVPKAEASGFAAWAKEIMQRAVRLSVPLIVDVKVGPNWQEMEKIAL